MRHAQLRLAAASPRRHRRQARGNGPGLTTDTEPPRETRDRIPIPAAIADAIIEHARAGLPHEACGVIVGSAEPAAGGVALRFEPCRNAAASAYRFTIDPADVIRILVAADAAQEVVWAIVHSHVASPAVPSATDLDMARWWPSALWLLASLDPAEADPRTRAPSLRAWRIVDGVAAEVVLDPVSAALEPGRADPQPGRADPAPASALRRPR